MVRTAIAIWFLLMLGCCLAFGQNANNGGFLQHRRTASRPPPASGSALTPGFHLQTNQVDTSTQFLTNTIDFQAANGLIVNIWHQWSDHNFITNVANGVVMTLLCMTNGYNANGDGFGVAYYVPPTNGIYKVANNNSDGSPTEKTVITMLFTNCHQTTPFGTAIMDWTATTRPGATNTVTSTANDLIFDAIAWNVGAVGSVGSGQTIRATADPAPNDSAISSSTKVSENGTSTMRWSGFSAGVMGHIAAAIKEP